MLQPKMIVAIDFDGTLAKDAYPEVGELDKDAIWVLYRLRGSGHKLILYTCREGEQLVAVLEAFAKEDIRFHAVNAQVEGKEAFGRKPYADLYIDDRAYPQKKIDWNEIEKWLEDAGWLIES
ncbi:MAG: hypothetical protein ACYCOR_10910 [Acidobacteriaceae bacterium]